MSGILTNHLRESQSRRLSKQKAWLIRRGFALGRGSRMVELTGSRRDDFFMTALAPARQPARCTRPQQGVSRLGRQDEAVSMRAKQGRPRIVGAGGMN